MGEDVLVTLLLALSLQPGLVSVGALVWDGLLSERQGIVKMLLSDSMSIPC